jgi:hypothetical protein
LFASSSIASSNCTRSLSPEGLLGLFELPILGELSERGLEPLALLALADAHSLGGDGVPELRDIGLGLALLDALPEFVADLLGLVGELLEPLFLGLVAGVELGELDDLLEALGYRPSGFYRSPAARRRRAAAAGPGATS